MENVSLEPELTLSETEQYGHLHTGNLQIIQDKSLFMFGIDAVLLSDFAAKEIKNTDEVIDLGTGNGIIPLLLSATSSAKKITGVELQEKCANLALRNVKINNLEEKIQIVNCDVKQLNSNFKKSVATVITTNPPYMKCAPKQNRTEALTIARHEICGNLNDFVKAADYLLKSHGRLFMIHRPERLPEIFISLKACHLEPKRMQLIYPYADKAPNLVMIEARKNANPDLIVEKPLIVYKEKCVYSDDIQKIYGKL